jgi:diaminohydroxyphosphoribosylaminopyrimidine deaminase/5-amino-6-(5-phosphoribosylamino)uracil reductase
VRSVGVPSDTGGPHAAYLNLEPAHGPCAGERSAVDALLHSGVSRVVIGLPHPLPRLRGHAITALEAAGITVHAMSPGMSVADSPELSAAWMAVLRVNEALLHRVALGLPFSVWKYAMTLDGKIASSTGHSAWVTGTGAAN